MEQAITEKKPSKFKIRMNKVLTYLSKPQNLVLLILGVVLSITTIGPIISIVADTVMVHTGSIDSTNTGLLSGFTLYNWADLFTGRLSQANLLLPLKNTLLLAVFTCIGAVLYGGIFAYLVTRTNMKFKKLLSSIFIFPYIMPQWTLAVVWKNLFYSSAVTGGSNGLLVALTGIQMPLWWCKGLFPSATVLAIHYAPFAYILIGGIFRNMDANLEEAATILNTPKRRIFFRVTLPMVMPAVLSTVLLVFSSAMGSFPVPYYLTYTTLATKYVEMSVARAGEASILAVIMMVFGIAILSLNIAATSGRKNYTTVTGKSGQISRVNLGRHGKYVTAIIFLVLTLFTSIYPIISFATETFLPNPGDYSFLTKGNWSSLTLKWWTTSTNTDSSLFGQCGILHNTTIWNAYFGILFVAVCCSLLAGTIGTLVGYACSKNRHSKWANYVNSMAFLPYLLPALSVGVAFYVFGSNIGIYNTYLLLIIAGTVKYIPFASRSALNSMLQLSGEIEEAAVIQNIPWHKRMFKIIIPIQKSSIISGYMLPFMSTLRELTLFMLLCSQTKILTTLLDYFDEMGLYAFSSGINLILIVTILICNAVVNKLTGASINKGIGGN
ncbi:ABC transporter permease subunit [Caproicibacterium lactatifermentans]|uniref:ABC transporter permease subunit n=2 Tax=Caproicibacterium lactatifermentans TaxID=2666138 RepID=A0ABX6PVK4_9FIRM|nr:iron ABC transporter permease [Caproicibacterium lactatifermentans]QKO30332.1 ABC transporter permease subunit [Caproicibacterium lactatifermentans]